MPLQIGNIKLSNHANATVNNATLTGDVNIANTRQFTTNNNATKIGNNQSSSAGAQETVDNPNLNLSNT